MLGVQKLFPSLNYQGSFNLSLFKILALLGFGCIIAGSKEFFSYKTTTSPIDLDNATHLVTSGIYKYSRNPMYIGLALNLCGWAALIGSFLALIGVPIFIWSITKYQITLEESSLERQFGKSFLNYQTNVPRWL